MFLLNWLRQYKQIKSEYEKPKFCESCETLKLQLSIANEEKKQLLNRLLEKPEPEQRPDVSELKPIQTAQVPWNVRRQMLEAADRRRAQDLHQKKQEMDHLENTNVDDLEKMIGIKQEERENQIAKG